MEDPFRPAYHFSPPYGWMNDPNGLVYARGEYHLFYQYHPDSTLWGPMHWGHASSRDLVSWQHLPIALYPDENGLIFSGSAVVDAHNTAGFGAGALVAIFTHHLPYHQSQSLAYSLDDGHTWNKYPGNPVLPPPPDTIDFRDPKVFWFGRPDGGHWVMALSAGNAVLFYTSPDLIDWQPSGAFGPGFGATGGVWETPDLFELPVADSPETRWVLMVSVSSGAPAGGSGTQYFIGHFDGQAFISANPPETVLWADHGADYYAPQSWSDAPDSRRLAVAWLNNWHYALVTPANTFRGVFSLPRQLSLTQTEPGVRLVQQPAPELACLRAIPHAGHHHWENQALSPGENLLEGLHGQAVEILADFEIHSPVVCFGFQIRSGSSENTTIFYDAHEGKLAVDRTCSGRSDFYAGFAAVHSTELPPVGGHIHLHIFVDRTSVEVFANHGTLTFSDCIFPSDSSQGLAVFVEGGRVRLNMLDVTLLDPDSPDGRAG